MVLQGPCNSSHSASGVAGGTAHQGGKWQSVEGRPQKHRNAAGEKGICQAPTALGVAWHDQAELRECHVTQQV